MSQRGPAHSLSASDFRGLCQLVYRRTGIVLTEAKRDMVYRRLMRRTRALNLDSFSDYCRLLQQPDSAELPQFLNAITTNLTNFFREAHHFDYLRQQFLPRQCPQAGRRLRLWSAGCATGEEAYSLAITLHQALGEQLRQWDARILATDLDTQVLDCARAGIYHGDRLAPVPEPLRRRFFLRGRGALADRVKVVPELSRLITFRHLNLQDETWPMRGPFDAILCRNVLIYFDKPTQRRLVQRFAQLLRPGGLLLLGHSESLEPGSDNLQARGRTLFEKRPAPAAHMAAAARAALAAQAS